MAGIKFGIVGCGRIARVHAEEILAMPQATLAAVCDIDRRVLQGLTNLFGVKGYLDYAEMLEEKELDVIVICTPSGLHAEMGIMAAQAGKHVLVEKPIAMTLEDAERFINTCEERGVLLSVVLQKRFKPLFLAIKSAVEEGRFGKLSHAGATVRWNRDEAYFRNNSWRGKKAQDGGVIMNQAIHNIDLLQWLMGRVESIFAYTATRYRPIEAEDVGVVALKFASGALGVIEAASTVYPRNLEETFAVFGEKGTVVISGVRSEKVKTWQFSIAKKEDLLLKVGSESADKGRSGHRSILKDMVEAVKKGGRLAVDGREGLKSLEIVLGIYRSAETGMPVSLPLSGKKYCVD